MSAERGTIEGTRSLRSVKRARGMSPEGVIRVVATMLHNTAVLPVLLSTAVYQLDPNIFARSVPTLPYPDVPVLVKVELCVKLKVEAFPKSWM